MRRRILPAVSTWALLMGISFILFGQTPAPVPLEPYCIVIPETGTYQFWHKVIAKDDNSDSFFIRINGSRTEFIDDACEGYWPCDGTFWTPMHNRTTQGIPDGTKQQPYTMKLTKGQKLTISMRVREAGIQLVEIGVGTGAPQ